MSSFGLIQRACNIFKLYMWVFCQDLYVLLVLASCWCEQERFYFARVTTVVLFLRFDAAEHFTATYVKQGLSAGFTSGPFDVVPTNPSSSAPSESSPPCARVRVRRRSRFALCPETQERSNGHVRGLLQKCFRTRMREMNTHYTTAVAHLY